PGRADDARREDHPDLRGHEPGPADRHGPQPARRMRSLTMTTNTTDVRTVGVVGCGLMGSGIAELCARRGLDTLVYEVDAPAVEAGRGRIESSLARAVERGRLTADDRDATLKQVAFTTDLADFADRDLAIEAVPEDEELKLRVFVGLDEAMTRPDAL